MSSQAPSLDTSLALRAKSYFSYAQLMCVVLMVLTVFTDALAVGPQPEQILLRALEALLPLALFAYGRDRPEHHTTVVYLAMGWWGLMDAIANVYSNSMELTLMMGALLLAAQGVFAEPLHRAFGRLLAHAALICLGIHVCGEVLDERAIMILAVGVVAGTILAGGTYRAEERSLELQLQAWEAQQAAEAAAQSRVEFLARMSHELRTPLNGMLGMLQMLREDGPLNGEQQEDLRVATRSSKQLLTLVTDLLDFSVISTGQALATPLPTRLRPPLQARVDELQAAVPHLHFELQSTVPEGLCIDRAKVLRIVDVLLDNAVKFTLRGSIRVAASFDGASLSVEVIDTGVGLPEDIRRLFKAFEQADGTGTRRFGGAGLGLALSRHLAESMDGTLQARPRMDQGSIFTLRVPATPCAAPAPSERGGELSGHLLLVEDNPINQLVLKGMLTKLGLQVSTANNGQEALDCVQETEFDAVLMDFHMPVMDGMEATQRLRAQGLNLPIIGVSASVMPQDKRAALASGMDHTIGKPVSLPLLARTLAEYLPEGCLSRHTSVA